MAKYPRKDRRPTREPWYDVENTVSNTECTGIAPTPAMDDVEASAYAALYAIHRPKVNEEEDHQVE